jgi:hypothetical protein
MDPGIHAKTRTALLSTRLAPSHPVNAENEQDRWMHDLEAESEPDLRSQALYRALLGHEERFNEFKWFLTLYAPDPNHEDEPDAAAAVRARLNARLREWVGPEFGDLSASQVLLWRCIVVEERFGAAPSGGRRAH